MEPEDFAQVPRTECICVLVSAFAAALHAEQLRVGPVAFNGLIDAYYSVNLNHPASRANQLRNFDVTADRMSLSMAKLTVEHSPGPLGFHVDIGAGRALDLVHGSEKAPVLFRNLPQAFVSYRPARLNGLQLDFGKFVTGAGAEVLETDANWNYSRSLLFVYAIPYYHFGLRATAPVSQRLNAGVYVVNGWNNVKDNNRGKTVGLIGTITFSKGAWTHTYLVGPEREGAGWRRLYDTTLLLTPAWRAHFYLNFDYGVERAPGGVSRWVGLAGAARLRMCRRFSVSPRLEWFDDRDGLTTGRARTLRESTVTGEFKLREGLFTRLEYRRDWSSRPMFERGAMAEVHHSQATVLLGLLASFGRAAN